MVTSALPAEEILVVGGTGKTGRRVAARLKAQGLPVRIASRSGQPSFDWEDPASWPSTLRGVGAAYVTYYPDVAFSGAADRVGAFARLAVEHGVRRLVLLSGRNEPEAQRAEQLVQDAGAEWTVVRSSFFAQNFSEGFFRDAIVSGVLALPAGMVAEPFIDADDIAEVAAAALTDESHVGQVYEVTGPKLLTFADVAAEISAATGRRVAYLPITPDEFSASLRAEGLPDDFVSELTALFTTVLDGRNTCVTDGIHRALGRAPRDFRDFATAAARAGAWDAPAMSA